MNDIVLKRNNFIILTDNITSKKGNPFRKDNVFKIDFIGGSLIMMRNSINQYTFSITELKDKYIIIDETTAKEKLKEIKKNSNCEFCILDNMDGINTCTLYGKQASDMCISKEYTPNKNNCDRYKNNTIL